MIILLCCFLVFLVIMLKKEKSNKVNKVPLPSNKPMMFGRVSCPYTVKMIDELKKHKVFDMFIYVNTETKKGAQLMQKYGGSGVPFFISNGRKGHGFMPKSKLFEKLNL